MAKKQQRFTQKPTVFEPSQEEIDAVLADVFEAERLAQENHALEMLAADAEREQAQEDELREGIAALQAWPDDEQPDYETCPDCGGSFGGERSEPSHYELCPVCGSILNTRSEDSEQIIVEYFCDYCGESIGFSLHNACLSCGAGMDTCDAEELSEETQPIPPLSERVEVVDDAIREDEIRDLEQVGLAWWLDMPIPFELTPLAAEFLSKLGRE